MDVGPRKTDGRSKKPDIRSEHTKWTSVNNAPRKNVKDASLHISFIKTPDLMDIDTVQKSGAVPVKRRCEVYYELCSHSPIIKQKDALHSHQPSIDTDYELLLRYVNLPMK